jgi:hypothetical protein
MEPDTKTPTEFERHSAAPRQGLVAEFLQFLGHNQKWWLLPIIIVLLIVAVIAVLGQTAVAPFIYTLF